MKYFYVVFNLLYYCLPVLHFCSQNEINKFKKEHYVLGQDNEIYTFSIQLSFLSVRQDKSKLQKQINKLLILTEMTA